jgi:ABC-type multidrug transport system fused ATPase/permease subunit
MKNNFEIIQTIQKTNKITGSGLRYRFLFVLQLIVMIVEFAQIFAVGMLLEGLTKLSGSMNFTDFLRILAFALSMNILRSFVGQYLSYLEEMVSEITYQKLSKNAIAKIVEYPLVWHESLNAGNKSQIIRDGSQSISSAIKMVPQVFNLAISTLVTICYLGFVNIWLLPLGMISILVSLSTIYLTQPKLKSWRKATTKNYEDIHGKIFESLNNISVLKSSGKFRNILLPMFVKFDEVFEIEKKVILLLTARNFGLKLVIVLIGMVYLGYGGYLIFAQSVAFGIMYAGYRYLMKLSDEVSYFTKLLVELGIIQVRAGRFWEIYDLQIQDNFKNKLTLDDKIIEKIEIKDLSFGYGSEENLQLKNLNLTISKGQKIGLVGTTGSGKSTFVKLLSGLSSISSGQIIFKTKDSDFNFYDLSLEAWHQHQFLVSQDPELFSASILQNITFFDSSPDLEKLQKAILISQLTTVIEDLSEGLETLIGEKGYKLSGGQRQRIGIARAIYSGCNIICFDESTSSLDSKTEQDFQVELEKNWQDQTLIFVAHRLSTLKNVDIIYVFENGKIIESGNFGELVQKNGKFAQLWQLQQKAVS